MGQRLWLLWLGAAVAWQAPRGRVSGLVRRSGPAAGGDPSCLPPAGDLILIDGDNVRGKTGFKLSAAALVGQARATPEAGRTPCCTWTTG